MIDIDFYPVAPSEDLKSIVKSFFVMEYDGNDIRTDYLLPDGLPSFFYIESEEVVNGHFHDSGHGFTLQQGVYVGYSNTLVAVEHQQVKVIGASLYPVYLGTLFGKNPFEFTNKFSWVQDFEHIASYDLSNVSMPNDQVIRTLEMFIRDKLQKDSKTGSFLKIYQSLTSQIGNLKNVQDLANSLGCSKRYVSTLFQKQLGMSPKKFLTLVRFNHALKLIDEMPEEKLSYIAYQVGYHDQAHFNVTSKRFVEKRLKS